MDDEYIVRLIDLPHSIKGVTQYDEEGMANIYINARLNDEQQRIELYHELGHVQRDDAYNDLSIEEAEKPKRSKRRKQSGSGYIELPVFWCE